MIIFISNFVSPHTRPLSDELFRQSRGNFMFIETMEMSAERKSLGYNTLRDRPYIVKYEEYISNKQKYQQLINTVDTVLVSYGSIDINTLKSRIIDNRQTFLMSERLFKKSLLKLIDPKFWKTLMFINKVKNKNFHLLCMGGYVARDFQKCGFPRKKMWKFGYVTNNVEAIGFPRTNNSVTKILWVGRMIWWKQPFEVIKAAEILHRKGYKFNIDVIGDGYLTEKYKQNLSTSIAKDEIVFHGLKTGDDVQKFMKQSDLLLCTSNRLEGWGAVINEGLNNGCLVIANKQMGAVPYLIEDSETGYAYDGSAKKLAQKIEYAINYPNQSRKIARQGYKFIHENWCPEHVASQLLSLIYNLKSNADYYNPSKKNIVCSNA